MLLLTLVCALISAAAIAVVALWHRFAPVQAGLAHEKTLYANFVADLDRRLAAGEIDAGQAQEEKVEAGRALLKAQGHVADDMVKPVYGLIVVATAVALSFGLYLWIGHPEMNDRPYKARLQQWTHMAREEPESVPPEVMAVVLRQGEDDPDKARNPDYWAFLGRIDMIAGNSYAGMKDYKTALALAPQSFSAWSELGEAITLVAGGNISPEAQKAFDEALKRDPADARAHVYLARGDVAAGRFDQARQHFRTALDHMAVDNPSRPDIEKELAAVGTAQTAASMANQQIGGMVAALAAQLKADPDNADGWARLLRSYNVLGDVAAHDAAVANMQAHYKDRPEVAAAIIAKSRASVGREGGA